MKKILLFILIFIGIENVGALEYNVEDNSDKNVIIQRYYKYYSVDKVLGPLVTLDEPNFEYPYIDKNIYECTLNSELLQVRPIEKEGRNISEYDGYKYRQMPFIKYMDIVSNGETIDFSNLKFFYDGKLLNYEVDENYTILGNGKIRFNFEERLNPKLFKVQFYLNDNESNEYNLSLIFGDDKDFLSIKTLATDNILMNIDVKIYPIKLSNYNTIYSLEKLEENNYNIFSDNVKLYTYEDCKYQSYKYEKNYYDDYLLSPLDKYIYRDDNNYKDFIISTNKYPDNIQGSTADVQYKLEDKYVINEISTTNTLENNNDLKELETKNDDENFNLKNNDISNDKENDINKNETDDKNEFWLFIFYYLILLLILLIVICKRRKK